MQFILIIECCVCDLWHILIIVVIGNLTNQKSKTNKYNIKKKLYLHKVVYLFINLFCRKIKT